MRAAKAAEHIAAEITAVVSGIADDLDDGLADWLVDIADSPSGWFFGQCRDRL